MLEISRAIASAIYIQKWNSQREGKPLVRKVLRRKIRVVEEVSRLELSISYARDLALKIVCLEIEFLFVL